MVNWAVLKWFPHQGYSRPKCVDLISWLLWYTSVSLAMVDMQFSRERRGAEETFPASSHPEIRISHQFKACFHFSLSTPAARNSPYRGESCSALISISTGLSQCLHWQRRIMSAKEMSYDHMQGQKMQGTHLVETGKNQKLFFFQYTWKRR